MDRTDDDLELEVSDLRTGRTLQTPLTRQPPAEPSAGSSEARMPQGEPDPGDAELTVEPIAARHRVAAPGLLASRRARGFAIAGLVAFVCAAILLTLPGPRQSLQQALAGPTPTPTPMLAYGADGFYLVNTVPWGSLTVDGGPPIQPEWGTSTTLPRGRHSVEYRADPFPSLRCQVTVPADGSDTCPLTTQYGFGPAMGAARVIDLGLTPGKLPPGQHAALEHTVAAALQGSAQSTTVVPGDHYLGADGSPAVATAALRATRTLGLNTDPARNPMYGPAGQCVSVCDDFVGGAAGDRWLIQAHVVARWQFAAPDGSAIAPANGGEQDATIGVEVGWTNGVWSANPQVNHGYDPLCDGAFATAFQYANPLPNIVSTTGMSADAPDGISGCVQMFTPASDNVTGAPPAGPYATPTPLPADAAIFISHFGAVLAGNDAAHAAQPQLPVATPHEQALAQQWLARQGVA